MPRPPTEIQGCQLCGRMLVLEFHHLIPRRNHRRQAFRRRFDRDEMRTRGCWVCGDCHRAVHRLHDERTLGLKLNTLEALQDDPGIREHVAHGRGASGARSSAASAAAR